MLTNGREREEVPGENLMEKLAYIEHQRWADWQAYLFSVLEILGAYTGDMYNRPQPHEFFLKMRSESEWQFHNPEFFCETVGTTDKDSLHSSL